MLHSGIDPIDGAIGGLAAGRVHVLTGAPGTGKTAACLQFAYTGLRRGEPVVMVVTQSLADVRALAAFMGLDLRPALLEERLTLLRWQGGATDGAAAATELRAVLAAQRPTRVVVDSVLPFAVAAADGGAAVAALADALAAAGSAGATTLVTCAGDLAHAYDRRLDPLLRDAAAILHLSRDGWNGLRAEVVRGPTATDAGGSDGRFVVEPRRGIVAPATHTRTGRLLLLHTTEVAEPETLALLGRDHAVTAWRAGPARLGGATAEPADAVVVELHHRALDDALALVRELARRDGALPILTFARFNVRSADRARALAAGADDTLSGDMSAAELRARLTMAIERGRVRRPALPAPDDVPVRQPVEIDGRPRPMDAAAFARALTEHAAGPQGDAGVVVDVAGPADVELLAHAALRAVRVGAGDLVAVVESGVAVYLHGARRRDTTAFVERLRDDWSRLGPGPLRVAVRTPARDDVGSRADQRDAVPA